MNIAHNLERSQQLFPQKIAMIFEGNRFTYQKLNELSNQITNGLAQLGISRGDRVALWLPNIPAFLTSYFGLQKLGAVAVTLNTSLKAPEMTFILNDCQAQVLITTAALRNQLVATELPWVRQIFLAEGEVATGAEELFLTEWQASFSSQAQAIDLECDEPAVIIYTSGTTGFPKGATLSQGNIVSNVRMVTYTLRLQVEDRILLCLPAFHNYGQYATFNPCIDAAATLVLHRDFEPDPILRSITEHQVTSFFGVPTLYNLLYEKAAPEQLTSLKRCISAGAPLPEKLANQWHDKFGLVINQIYGLTECSMVGFNHFFKHRLGSIGTPVEGTELKIIDDAGLPVSRGELGEIVVRGPSVMLGYWNRPEATAEALKEGWFYTGDMGRQDEDGYVYLVDRRKDMVNVGGEKVYPAEVEQVLSQHPAVAEVAVYGVPESLLGEQVRANIILKTGQKVTAAALIEFCRRALADYKVPSVIQLVESLPKGRTGKVLKRLLREEVVPATVLTSPASATATPHSPSRITQTAAEQRAWVSQWLRENLSLEAPVVMEQPFNEYGLTSLLAVKLVTELNEWLGTSFEPIIVWNYPTINRLVTYLSQTHDSKQEVSRMELWPAIDPYHVYDPLMYQRMRNDTVRTEIYRLAIARTVANKVVLEIGPGPEANLTRLCAEAGAKHIYAVELDETAYRQAQALVTKLGLADKITLIHGDVTQISLPELADACVSGLAGQIGGSEGVVALLNQTRPLLTPEALIIPQRYVSKIAAVTLPDLPIQLPPLGWQYTQKIFDQVGHPFDLRVIINHFDTSGIISDRAIFEEIDFTKTAPIPTSYQHDIRLTITRSGRLDGFIIWLTLHTIEGVMMDVLETGNLWLPVYFPTFHPSLRVSAGDVIEATCIGSLSDNHINPNYRLKGRLIRAHGDDPVAFDHWSPHHDHYFQRSSFYRELFKHWPTGKVRPTHHSDTLPLAANEAGAEPIAIIGLGCRFPGGADTLDKFWEILQQGVDTVTAIPPDRWDIDGYYDANPEALGKMYVRAGSFLPEVDKFDASFFGLPPLETRSLDPQQRLLLEVCWESLENAGLAPQGLRNSQTGLFIGSFWDDYSTLNLYQDTPTQIDAYRILSSLRGMHAGRLSYLFQFHGPSMQIDTACSSSLLAIHLACQSLRAQECDLAVAGGVTLFLSPEVLIGLSRTHALSPEGRSKPFAANADGFGVGEGAGTVVLKRLSDAKRDGDKILAVIKGSAVNHDGPSNGLTAPNGLAQEAVLRQALQQAHLSPDQIDYLEAHGTGTPLGDPIEVEALNQVFTPGRTRPLMIGSVKGNIGHLSAAAGIASLIKVVLSLQHGLIPPSLHFAAPNPYIHWQELPFLVPTQPLNWPRQAKLAGISSFGMTGTNVHLIVGEAPQPELLNSFESTLERPYHLLTLSGKTEQALNDQVTRYLDYLARHPELNLADMCYTANTGRDHFEHRLVVVAKDRANLSRQLRACQIGEAVKGVVRGQANDSPLPLAFLFTGQGSQYVDMGRELYDTHPLFRQLLQQCDAILRAYLDLPLLDLLYPPAQGPRSPDPGQRTLDQTRYTQPALFALEYALAKLWQSWGVVPDVVMGHSVGEYVAACVAGVFSLEDGLKLIAERGRLMQALPLEGRMVAVPLEEAALTPLLQPYLDQVSIASFNAPQSLVLSGQTDRLEEIIRQLEAQGVTCKRLTVSHAFHSPLMTPMLAEFEQVARSISYNSPRLKWVSNVTGQVITEVQADYWVQHVRKPVRFAQGMATVAELGVKVFIEIGPKPTLLGLGPLSVVGHDHLWLPSFYPQQQHDWQQLLESLGTWHVRGGRIAWRSFDQPYPRHKVSLPTYPFQRQRYWLEQRARTPPAVDSGHPLVGPMIRLPNSAEVHFQTTVSANSPAYLGDHRVFDQLLLPGTAHLEMVLVAGKRLLEAAPVKITNLTFQQPLILTAEEVTVQLVFTPVTAGYRWQLFSWVKEPPEWVLHSAGAILEGAAEPEATVPLAELQSRCPIPRSVNAHYQTCAAQGLDYGPAFQGLEKLFQGDGQALGLIRLPESLQAAAGPYQLHPALLDAGLQVSLGALSSESEEAQLPLALERFQLYAAGGHQVLWSYVKVRPQTDSTTRQLDLTLLSETGMVVAELAGLMVRPASREALLGSRLRTEWLYQLVWQPAPLPTQSPYTTASGRWLLLGDHPLGPPLAALLQAHGEQVVTQQRLGELYRGVVYLGQLTPEEADVPDVALTMSTAVLQLVQGLLQSPEPPRLWLVSHEAMRVPGGTLSTPRLAPTAVLWGLGRTLLWEHPQLQCSCLDLSADTTAETLFETIWFADPENQLALRQGRRHLARLARLNPPTETTQPYPCQLQLGQYGLLETLQLIPATRRPPQAGQVEIQVRAAGLNFRDVLNALGLLKESYPHELGLEDPTKLSFGFECSGTVVTVGAEVTEFQCGDAVIVWQCWGSMASFITVDAQYLTVKPPHLSFDEAATIPLTFLTAYYGLQELAQLQAGERVLIHAAAGGVGQAAIQIAQWLGAEIWATASPSKWNFLNSLGIEQVMNSRTLEFATQIRELTAGQGVDVVLNSLTGEYIPKSFEALAEQGRFIEIGKLGIWTPAQARRYRPQASYASFDLNEVRQQHPELVVQMQAKLVQRFANHELKPLPYQVFPLAQAYEAFQFMAQTKHIGKVVLSLPDHQTQPLTTVRPNGSYLLTGGLGGLGLKVAAWLVEQGARYLVLNSRRGLASEAAHSAIRHLESLGAKVLVVTADVSLATDVARLLAAAQQLAPLRGIIHAAGLLDDGIWLQQTAARFAKVFAPKVSGSWYLHQLSQELPLDFFVGFSSVASLLGHAGQANYAAANAFLDALMSHRHALGLPALSINWGGWSEVGLAANQVRHGGEDAISPAQGVACLGYLLNQSVTQVGVIPFKWAKFGPLLPVGAHLPLLTQFLKPKTTTSLKSALRQQLAQAAGAAREELLKQHLRAEIQTILGREPADDQGFFDLGMDSLMSIQLSNRLAASLEVSLPATLTLGYPTVTRLTSYLLDTIFGNQPTVIDITKTQTAQLLLSSPALEPIAIVGLGCRFPGGANDIEQFWQLLHDGRDGVIEIPPSRWPASEYYDPTRGTPNKMYVKQGAFLQFPIEQFDPQFFGIAPLEAQHLDPRQRLLLEVTWEALESAGLPAEQLPTKTGIFVGMIATDRDFNPGDNGVYAITGTATSIATGRLAYTLGVQGPNLAIDTACSSSLVALHLACQSLRAGECEVALCGGVQLMLAPELHLALSAIQALSPDGRCKTFSASADGYGRGEGCGMVVLKRLSKALENGDLIWSVIRGSAVNHDGRSSGLTVPNKVAQTTLIREALAKAQVMGHEVSYVEAHGTGTKLGDPNEMWALAEALGERETPLWIGSVKTNIGHLEASAGIAGVIKVALALHHGEIPPHLHFEQPNPLIDWANLPFQVPVAPTPWPAGEQLRIAGISSFGLSGTNAHVILAEAPHPDSSYLESKLERPYHLLTLSGKTEQALNDQVTRYLDYLARHPELNLADMCYTANTGRDHFEHRLVVVAKDRANLSRQLRACQIGEAVKGVVRGQANDSPLPLAFLFTGQGSQYVDMGRELYDTHPLFRQLLQQCDAILRAYLDLPLLDLLYPPAQGPRSPDPGQRTLDQTRYTQPALFALEYALAKLWQSWGVVPDVVMGHSVGEYVAACVAGVFSLEDGLKLIAERGRLMQALPLEGRMVAVPLEEAALTPLLQPYLDQVSIASFNAPQSLVLSGQTDRLEEIIRQLEAQGVTCKRLTVSHAFHSPLMTPMLAEFEQVARSISYNSPRLKWVSNVTGQVITEVQADYWVQHVRKPVRFAQGMATVAELGVKVFIEIGPKPTLLGLGPLSVVGHDHLWLPSFYPQQQHDWQQLLESLGTWHVRGGRIAWRSFDQPYPRHKVSLPTYPFQRQRYWLEQRARTPPAVDSGHPLVGPMIRLPNSAEVHFQTTVSANSPAYLGDHRVFDQLLLPGTAHLEMVLVAGKRLLEAAPVKITNLTFQQPLILTAEEVTVQLVFTPVTAGYRWQLFSWVKEPPEWVLHSAGAILEGAAEPEATVPLAELQSRCPIPRSVNAHYQTCAAQGLDYGPAFQGLEKLFQGDGQALGLIRLPESLQAAAGPYQLHPALLDAGLQVSLGALSSESEEAQLPLALERFQLYAAGGHQVLWSYVKVRPQTDSTTRQLDLTLLSETGMVVAELAGLMVRPASREALLGSRLRTEWLYQLVWQPAPLPTQSPYTTASGRWLLLGDHPLGPPLAALLQAHGEQVVTQQRLGELYRGVVYLGQLTPEEADVPDVALTMSTAVLQLVQGLLQSPEPPRLWLVSHEAMRVPGGTLSTPRLAPTAVLWGLGRTLLWEHPQLQCSCLDLSADTTAETLFETIWFADPENQLALRQGRRHLARLARLNPPTETTQPYPCQLQLGQYGLLETLQLIPATRRPPQAGQVEIQVRAAGLNFRDVLNALGLLKESYPHELGLEDPTKLSFGFECSGTVVTVGAEVTEFQCGDAVIVWQCWGSMASFITVDAQYLTVKPPHLSFDEAATIPLTFLTAYYGLQELAQLQAGERVLIHAAAGGVGQAAIQIAQWLGAEIWATASPSKWNFLNSLGIEQVMNSRTLEFATQIRELTAGQGVDVVLNSLTGEYIPKSFEALAEQGRFIEIGKLGIWTPAQARRYRPQASYASFDLNEVRQQHPELVVRMQAQLVQRFAKHEFKPLPSQVFPLAQAYEAFQFMAQTKHIGKVVLSLPDHQTQPLTTVRPNGSYLLTGGLGGLGLKVAAWLVEQGARYLVLNSRRGLASEAAHSAIRHLESLGAKVLVVTADVSLATDVARLLAAAQQLAPLRGIIHAAGLLDDGIWLQQTAARFAKVFAPKVSGSWYLHQLSQELPLDFFVGFSSVASLLGHAGQANYAAANAFLDALMSHRHALGLPALSINWGGWSEVGLAANQVRHGGEDAISPAQGVACLGYLLNQSVTQVGVIPFKWAKFGPLLPVGAHLPLLTQFLKPKTTTSLKSALRQQLAQAAGAAREELLKQHLRAEIQTILGREPADDQGFFDLGMDSLMSIQLSNRLAASLEVSLPATLTLGYPTVTRLTSYLLDTIFGNQPTVIDITKTQTAQLLLSSPALEPIAIVGLGCRFPGGANDIEQFWQLLHDGRDGVIDIPPSRWPASEYYDPTRGTPNKMYVKQGAFLQFPIEQFDPQFFGIAPLEAQHLDPRQRLLLEVTWEALESAGLPAEQLPTETGIFVGIIDTGTGFNHGNHGVYALTGTAASIATGRLAYTLGVQGPNLAVDTACSSSLVAVHLACQSLRAGECEVALCGGVQLMLAPDGLIALSAIQALSPDGRCKTFSASADGYGRGEGCGMVVLKRLSKAREDGDLIWSVIRGSAVNHDGRSSGLTVPNKVAQTALIRQALTKAQVTGHEVSYVEAHGTGTKLGDPNEMWALAEALGERETPLWIGSVKTNIGHLEASAGIAGVIKVALALHHEEIPPHLHFDQPNPLIDWASLPFQVPVAPTPWPASEQLRVAGISSFGLSGTNAHLILAEAPHPDSSRLESKLERPYHLLILSGKTEQALNDQVTRYLDYLARHPELNLADVCYTANTGRDHFEHRLVVVAKDRANLSRQLRACQIGEAVKGVVRGQANDSPLPLAFLFTGQGSQYVDMGRELYDTHPLFRQLLQQCDAILRAYLDLPLLDLLYPPAQGPRSPDPGQRTLDQTRYTQPALFALEYALAKLWQSWGVVPDVVMGHSVGEYVAACVAGVFSLEDGLKLIAERGRLMQALPLEGSMVAVPLEERALTPLLQPYLDQVSIASFNAPQSLVLSGQTDRLEEIIRQLEAQGITCKRLTVSHAFHSPLMTPMLAEFEQVARSISYSSPRLKLVSNVTGQVITEIQADYWVQHVRKPVRFAQGMATVAELGVKVFIEIGPKPTLLGLGPLSVVGHDHLWLPSFYPQQQHDWQQLLESLGTWHVHGGRIAWRSFDQPYPRHKVSLPTYPFQRQRYWPDQRARTHLAVVDSGHPLVGVLCRSPTSEEIHFQTTVSINYPAYLADHRVFEQPILPSTAYLEMALAAGKELFKEEPVNLTNVTFQQPLILTTEEVTVQLVFTPVTAGYRWQLFSWVKEPQEWVLHSAGAILEGAAEPAASVPLAELQSRCPIPRSVNAHYQACTAQGLDYGPAFQGLEKLFQGDGQALGLIRLPGYLQAAAGPYQLHPALLDAGLQVSLGALSSESEEAQLPLALERFQLYAAGGHQVLWSYVKVRPQTDSTTQQLDLTLLSETGMVVAELAGLMVRPASREALLGSRLRTEWLYQLVWQPAPLPTQSPYTTASGRWLLLGDHPLGPPLAALLQAHGEQVVTQQRLGKLYRGVVYLGQLTPEEADVPDVALTMSTAVLQLVQGLLQSPEPPRLWLVSHEAMRVPCGTLSTPRLAPTAVLWGLGRTLLWEHPQLQCSCLDLSADTTAETLFETIWFADPENQLALRQGRRHLARLARLNPPTETTQPYPCQLQLGQYGLLETLQLIPATRRPPQAGQVEIQVRAAGLNFRDVLNALGLLKESYPHELGLEDPTKLSFGFECSGTVVTVGAEVTEFQCGDAVIVWQCWGSMASFITVDAQYLTVKPPHLSFDEAATIPLTFLTAYYGLQELAQLQAGERVLIHAAAGGVGQAAIQIAQWLGAEIWATASPSKWNFLNSLGIEQVMNSRTLEFATQIRELTAGQGVDVVLNSLTGEYIPKSFEALAEQGRFIEIGKLGIWTPAQARRYRPQASYASFDLNEVRQQHPELVVQMQAKLVQRFANHELKPLPYQVFPLAQAYEAFQFMAQTKHIGKVVLSLPDHQTQPLTTVRPNGSYLLTGGLDGLGLKVAAWLVEQGARYLVLNSQRGLVSEAAQSAVRHLESLGAKVLVVTADVSHETDVARLLAAAQQLAPLRGIIHAAGLLDDGIWLQQTAARFAKVFAPKVSGSWYLHQLSQELPLDFFVGFSSVASLLGHAGQANYAAANAFLDALMSHRHALGLPALSINWGGWSEVGLAANQVRHGGEDVISPAQGVACLGYLLNQSVTQVGVIPFKWAKFGPLLPVGAHLPLLTQFLKPKTTTSLKSALRQQLAQAAGAAREELLKQHLRAEIQTILGREPADDQGFFDLGMDSLMSIQLSNRLAASLEVSLPATLALEYPTVERLVHYLAEHVLGWKEVVIVEKIDEEVSLKVELLQLSAAEVEISIAQELADLEELLDN